jgi:hypothetical protein
MTNKFKSNNAAILLGAGASKADDGVLENDLLNGIHDLAKHLTMNIPASEFCKTIGVPDPTYSFVLTHILYMLEEYGEKYQKLAHIYNSMIEGLLNIMSFSKGYNVKNDNHLKLFKYCLENCESFSVVSLNYDSIAESALIDLIRECNIPKIDYHIDFKDALLPLPKIPPFFKPPLDPEYPRVGSWAECELTKDSIRCNQQHVQKSRINENPLSLKMKYRAGNIDFLKLHGSIRWLYCQFCGIPYTVAQPYSSLEELKIIEVTLWMIGHHFPGFCALLCNRCGYPLRAHIVPPGPENIHPANLHKRYGLNRVWDKAFSNLVFADDWLFIGYSFPLYDMEIKYLLKEALEKRSVPPNIWIIDYFSNSKDGFNNSPVINRARQIFAGLNMFNINLNGFQHFPDFDD